MFLGRISYCMPNILENDDLMISNKLSILDVVKSFGFYSLVICFLFWHFSTTTLKNSLSERFQSRYVCDQPFLVPIPAKKRFKSRFCFDRAPNLVLNLSWSWYYFTSIPVVLLSRLHPSLGPDPVPALSVSRLYRGSVPVPMLS
jgi:hypothetical protein